jgi:hypothetical protein
MFSVVTIMKSLTYLAIILLLSWFLITQARKPLESCEFQAIFNFGDSNSDTGSMSAAFYPATLPYGETFFHEAVGRSSNGRLIIDFIGKQFYSFKILFIFYVCFVRSKSTLFSFCNGNLVDSYHTRNIIREVGI